MVADGGFFVKKNRLIGEVELGPKLEEFGDILPRARVVFVGWTGDQVGYRSSAGLECGHDMETEFEIFATE